MNSFSMSFTNVFADDKFLFQNAATKGKEILCRRLGEVTIAWTYDISKAIPTLMAGTPVDTVIILTDGTATYNFTMYGKVKTVTLPDPDKCVFEGNATIELMGTPTNRAYSIARSITTG